MLATICALRRATGQTDEDERSAGLGKACRTKLYSTSGWHNPADRQARQDAWPCARARQPARRLTASRSSRAAPVAQLDGPSAVPQPARPFRLSARPARLPHLPADLPADLPAPAWHLLPLPTSLVALVLSARRPQTPGYAGLLGNLLHVMSNEAQQYLCCLPSVQSPWRSGVRAPRARGVILCGLCRARTANHAEHLFGSARRRQGQASETSALDRVRRRDAHGPRARTCARARASGNTPQ